MPWQKRVPVHDGLRLQKAVSPLSFIPVHLFWIAYPFLILSFPNLTLLSEPNTSYSVAAVPRPVDQGICRRWESHGSNLHWLRGDQSDEERIH
jgi:hypothetical protein